MQKLNVYNKTTIENYYGVWHDILENSALIVDNIKKHLAIEWIR